MVLSTSKNLLEHVKKMYSSNSAFKPNAFEVGDIVRISYKTNEGSKEKVNSFEGIIICKKNSILSQTITLRRVVQGVAIEQVFPLNSPNILEIKKRAKLKVRRSKLYYLRKVR